MSGKSIHKKLMDHVEANYALAFLLDQTNHFTVEEIIKKIGITRKTWDSWRKRGALNVRYNSYQEWRDVQENG